MEEGPPPMKRILHRANTLESLRVAANYGFVGVEVDVRRDQRDGVLKAAHSMADVRNAKPLDRVIRVALDLDLMVVLDIKEQELWSPLVSELRSIKKKATSLCVMGIPGQELDEYMKNIPCPILARMSEHELQLPGHYSHRLIDSYSNDHGAILEHCAPALTNTLMAIGYDLRDKTREYVTDQERFIDYVITKRIAG